MQDRDKIEEEKDTNNTGEKMQGRNTTGQEKTEQTEEAETTKKEQKEKGTAEHIVNNQQKNTEKQGKSREEGEKQEKTTDVSKYTEPQPQQEYKNQQTKTRIKNQNEVEAVDKENFEIERQKPYKKSLDPNNTSDREENNSEIQRLNVHTEQNKGTDDIMYPRKYWKTGTEEGNGLNIRDRTRNSYNNGELNHTANNHNKNMIDKERKVETQESELVQKETFNINIQTSYIEQYKYPHSTNVSSDPIIDRVLHQKGSGKELNQNKDARVTDIGKRIAGKNLRGKQKEEINKEICPYCNKYVETGIECGQCGNWFHYKCEDTTEEQVKNHYPAHMHYICKKCRLTKFANAENTNNPNQDKIVVELREKLRSSEMRQKEMEPTLNELKKVNEITKESLVEYQTETVKLLQEKKMSEEIIKTFQNFNTIKIKAAKELQIKNKQKCLENK